MLFQIIWLWYYVWMLSKFLSNKKVSGAKDHGKNHIKVRPPLVRYQFSVIVHYDMNQGKLDIRQTEHCFLAFCYKGHHPLNHFCHPNLFEKQWPNVSPPPPPQLFLAENQFILAFWSGVQSNFLWGGGVGVLDGQEGNSKSCLKWGLGLVEEGGGGRSVKEFFPKTFLKRWWVKAKVVRRGRGLEGVTPPLSALPKIFIVRHHQWNTIPDYQGQGITCINWCRLFMLVPSGSLLREDTGCLTTFKSHVPKLYLL